MTKFWFSCQSSMTLPQTGFDQSRKAVPSGVPSPVAPMGTYGMTPPARRFQKYGARCPLLGQPM